VLGNDTVHTSEFRTHIELARFLYPAAAALDDLRDVLDDIRDHGLEPVLTKHRAAHEHAMLLQQWVHTTTWDASLKFARDHPDLRLADDTTVAVLRGDGTNPVIAQRAAIAALTRTMPLTEVYDAVTDPQHAADLAMRRLEEGYWDGGPRRGLTPSPEN
jgi:hypothetical protein